MLHSLFAISVLIFCVIEYCHCGLIYMCREFGPDYVPCGKNRFSFGPQWVSAQTRFYPKVSANIGELQEYVLILNATSSPKTIGRYMPSVRQLTPGVYCIQVEMLYSDLCLNSKQTDCTMNVQFQDAASIYVQNASKFFNYRVQQMLLLNYEFNITTDKKIQPAIIGSIFHDQIYVPPHPLYIAIKEIQILDGHCPVRIGTRQEFWIIIMVIFSLLTTYTFVHIAIEGMIKSHRSRKAKAEAQRALDESFNKNITIFHTDKLAPPSDSDPNLGL